MFSRKLFHISKIDRNPTGVILLSRGNVTSKMLFIFQMSFNFLKLQVFLKNKRNVFLAELKEQIYKSLKIYKNI